MSNPNVLGDEYVYSTMHELFSEHIGTYVNEEMMQAMEPVAFTHYQNFIALGIPHERIKIASGIALRDAWKGKVAVDNISPGDFL